MSFRLFSKTCIWQKADRRRAVRLTDYSLVGNPAFPCLPASLTVNFAKASQLWQSVDTYHQESWLSPELSSFKLQSGSLSWICLVKRGRGGVGGGAAQCVLCTALKCVSTKISPATTLNHNDQRYPLEYEK